MGSGNAGTAAIRAHLSTIRRSNVWGGKLPRSLRRVLIASTALAVLAAPVAARADDFQGLGFLPGGTSSQANAVNADGTVVVGSGENSGPAQAFRWTSGGMVGLGFLPGGSFSDATGVNADGSVVVGSSDSSSGQQAFRWTSGGMVGLGFLLGGTISGASAVNADGSVVVGFSDSLSGDQAFRWTSGGMVGLGFLPGGSFGGATGVNADGSVVVGFSTSTNFAGGEAFRWTSAGMVGLGVLPGGTLSQANGVSADGSVVVGYSTSTNVPFGEAFRWTSAGMVGLGVLPGGTFSQANGVSADGSVLVGYSDSSSGQQAIRWTSGTGMKSILDLLVASGVNMAGWQLSTATGVSADGTVIVGTGTDPSSQQEAWLMRCTTTCAMLTPGVVAQSFSGQSAMGQTGNAALGNTLGTFAEYATQGGNAPGNTPFSAFGYGGYDSDPAASGTLGMTMKLPDRMVAGAALSANYVKTDMVYDGSSKMTGGSAGLFLARMPDAGLQWLVGATGLTLKGDVTRGYLNGNSPASSTGNTTANGYGATARIGWTFGNVWRFTQVTPFASYTYSSIHFNGYTESGGPFPAQMDGFTSNAQTSRLGADARYTLAPGKWLWGTLAWAHRLDGGKGADISGTIIGLFGMSAPGASVATDWAEVTAGIRLPAWKNGAVTASLTASVPSNVPTTYAARLGVSQTF
ncbi:MAG TPA: autotransporter domain-containing protein [Pseudolabrys sp.]